MDLSDPRGEPSRAIALLRAALADQRLRYLIVGGYNTLFGFGLFALVHILFAQQVHYLALLTGCQVISVLNAFVAYRTFVFRVAGPFWPQLMRFSSVYIAALLANLVLLPALVEGLRTPVIPSQAFLAVATVVASFIAHRRFSFGSRELPREL